MTIHARIGAVVFEIEIPELDAMVGALTQLTADVAEIKRDVAIIKSDVADIKALLSTHTDADARIEFIVGPVREQPPTVP